MHEIKPSQRQIESSVHVGAGFQPAIDSTDAAPCFNTHRDIPFGKRVALRRRLSITSERGPNVLANAVATRIHCSKVALGFGVAQLCRLPIPHDRAAKIASNSQPGVVVKGKVELRLRIAMARSATIPSQRFPQVLSGAGAVSVKTSQVEFRIDVALLRGSSIPFCGDARVPADARPTLIANA
ncbi:MAG TPA: hypothetical protein VGX76_15490 [Pirellulales bacterium]|nr:hypothetical protein [Pirellulales bacterium]